MSQSLDTGTEIVPVKQFAVEVSRALERMWEAFPSQ